MLVLGAVVLGRSTAFLISWMLVLGVVVLGRSTALFWISWMLVLAVAELALGCAWSVDCMVVPVGSLLMAPVSSGAVVLASIVSLDAVLAWDSSVRCLVNCAWPAHQLYHLMLSCLLDIRRSVAWLCLIGRLHDCSSAHR